jgi:hypothetical protein
MKPFSCRKRRMQTAALSRIMMEELAVCMQPRSVKSVHDLHKKNNML